MNQVSSTATAFADWLKVYGPKIVGAVVVLIVGLYITNLIGRLVAKGLNKRKIDVSLQSFFGSMISVALKVLLLVSVAEMLGIQTTSFVAVIGALGLAVGLALQGSLANFAGGVLLLVFKPFKIGDLIEAGGQTGVVQEIQIFNTILLTADHKTVILANAGVSNGTITNHSKHGDLRVDIVMALAANTDIDFAREVAMETMKANKFVLQEPAATFNVLKVGDGMVTFAVRPYATPEHYWDAYFTVQEELRNAFSRNNIQGPVPTTIIINKQFAAEVN